MYLHLLLHGEIWILLLHISSLKYIYVPTGSADSNWCISEEHFFSWFNDILIKSQWILGSSDREILYKTFSFCLINLTWPPGPQKEKVKKCYGMWVIWLVLSESWKRLESGGYKVCFCFDWSINQTENSLNLSDMDIKIGKLSIFYQISPSQDSKNNLILLRMSFNHKESSSEMHQFECTL